MMRVRHGIAAAVAVGLLSLSAPFTPAATAATGQPGDGSVQQLKSMGRVDLAALAAAGGAIGRSHARTKTPDAEKEADSGASALVPHPPATPVAGRGPASGFPGLNIIDNVAVNGFEVEPPDQALCAGQGRILEAVNLALRVDTQQGGHVTSPVSLNAFFGLAPAFDPVTGVSGPFLSDPKCFYDPQVRRWFVSILEIDVDPTTGAFGQRSSVLLAVSGSRNPAGSYTVFSIDTTDDGSNGTPSHPQCPCFGDQPLIGADANGFYISTNEYSIATSRQNNAQLFAISKQGLADLASGGNSSAAVVHIDAGRLSGFPSQSLQPATTPPGGTYAHNLEYFLSANDFSGLDGGDQIVTWALSGTGTLDRSHPNLDLSRRILDSEPYAGPVPAAQKAGPRPLGTALGEPLPKVEANDDRMQQVIYTRGLLVSNLNTGIGGNQANRDGIAWFVVEPGQSHGRLTASIRAQGYLNAAGQSLVFGAVGLDASGVGAMTFTLVGPSQHPSAAYVAFDTRGPHGPIHVAARGAAPEDGFSCYVAFGGDGVCRWGDYSAAVAADGAIFLATEYIPGPRTDFANWGTFVIKYPV